MFFTNCFSPRKHFCYVLKNIYDNLLLLLWLFKGIFLSRWRILRITENNCLCLNFLMLSTQYFLLTVFALHTMDCLSRGLYPWIAVAVESLSHVWVFASPWPIARQAPLSMGFSRQEYRSGLPCPPPGDLPDPGVESASPALPGGFFNDEPPGKPVCLDNNGEIKEAKTLK